MQKNILLLWNQKVWNDVVKKGFFIGLFNTVLDVCGYEGSTSGAYAAGVKWSGYHLGFTDFLPFGNISRIMER